MTQRKTTETDGERQSEFTFEFGGYLRVKRGSPIHGVEFCNCLRSGEPVIFATVGGNCVSIYECKDNEIKMLRSYMDPDQSENFFTCCWTYDPNALNTILIFGGARGIIRFITAQSSLAAKVLIDHTIQINDLKVHPRYPSILLSASGDRTLRLWNIETGLCIAVFGGGHGHMDQVVSADFDFTGSKIVSGGADHSMKIWCLDREPIIKSIENSYIASDIPFRILLIRFPDFTTSDVHHNIVDCVKWYGNFVLSKTNANVINCWATEPALVDRNQNQTGDHRVAIEIHRFRVMKCTDFYIRFSLDSNKKFMAIGNNVGDVYVWLLDGNDPTKSFILRPKNSTKPIRQTAFSPDGEILIAVSDTSTIYRWNIK